MLKIQSYARAPKKELGDKFSDKEFHDVGFEETCVRLAIVDFWKEQVNDLYSEKEGVEFLTAITRIKM